MASVASALADYFLDREHGSKRNQVPEKWRQYRTLWSVYPWSSFMFSLVGLNLFYLLERYPDKQLYAAEKAIEVPFFIWQGVASFLCDYVDLGVPSWSHPADRISATGFTIFQVVKFLVVLPTGVWPLPAVLVFPPGLACGLFAFRKSWTAVDRHDAEAFFWWHAAWHFAFPIPAMIWHWLYFTS